MCCNKDEKRRNNNELLIAKPHSSRVKFSAVAPCCFSLIFTFYLVTDSLLGFGKGQERELLRALNTLIVSSLLRKMMEKLVEVLAIRRVRHQGDYTSEV